MPWTIIVELCTRFVCMQRAFDCTCTCSIYISEQRTSILIEYGMHLSKLYKHRKPLAKYCGTWKFCRKFLFHCEFRCVWEWECAYTCLQVSYRIEQHSTLDVASVFMFIFGMGRQFLNLSWQRQTTRNSTLKFELLKIYCQQCHDAMQTMFVHIPYSAHHSDTHDAKWTDTTKLNAYINMRSRGNALHFV